MAWDLDPCISSEKKRNKLYVGLLFEYSKMTFVYDPSSHDWDGEEYTYNYYIIAVHPGYRFRFDSGFFVNLGAYFFMLSEIYPVKFRMATIPIETGTKVWQFPFPSPDIRLGIEF